MKSLVWLIFSLLLVTSIFAQPKGYLYDEAKVPHYTLPDLLTTQNGATVKTVKDWEAKRRPEVLALFEEHMYGRAPGRPAKLSFQVVEEAERCSTVWLIGDRWRCGLRVRRMGRV